MNGLASDSWWPWFVVVVVSVLLVYLTLATGIYRRLISQLRSERDELRGELDALVAASFEAPKTMADLTEALRVANDAMRDAEYLAAKEKRRADEQFAVIEDFDKEKRQIWEIYRDSCLGAGNCQDLLFNEMARIVRLHNALAQKHGFDPIEIRSGVREALRKFANNHRNEPAIKAKLDEKMDRSTPG